MEVIIIKSDFVKVIKREIFSLLDKNLKRIIKQVAKHKLAKLTEIRLRANKPLILEFINDEMIIDCSANPITDIRQAYLVKQQEIKNTLNLMAKGSFYTLEDEFKSGYLTLQGGHRVGMVGEVVKKDGKIARIKNIAALNIRISREIIGAANGVIRKVIKGKNDIYNTLIISSPACGKTTLLRDLARQISNGSDKLNFKGLKVGVVDERSEIAGAYKGVSQNRLGIRTDLIDRCPKAEGMMLLIRAMSPEVLITDEIGSKADFAAIKEALNAGVRIVTTMHASNLAEARTRAGFEKILDSNIFSRIIILSRKKGPGTIEKIIKRG